MRRRGRKCFIKDADTARQHLRVLRGGDANTQQTDALIAAGRVIGEMWGKIEAQRRLVDRAVKHSRRLQKLRRSDRPLYDRMRATAMAVPVEASAGFATRTSGATFVEIDEDGTVHERLETADQPGNVTPDEWVQLQLGNKVSDLEFNWAAWHAAIAGDPPLPPGRKPLTSPIMHLLVRAYVVMRSSRTKLKDILEAFVSRVADVLGVARPTNSHWALIEVCAGIESTSADPDQYVTLRKRWERRHTATVAALMKALSLPARVP